MKIDRQKVTTLSTGLSTGFRAPWRGFQYMQRHPGLWRHGVIPMILNVLITFAALAGLIVGIAKGVGHIHPRFPAGAWWFALEILTIIGLVLLAIGLALAAWKLAEGILCGHFYGKLAREVELQLGIDPAAIQDIPLRYQVVDSVRDLAALIAANVGLLPLHCVPGVGSLAATVGSLYFDALILGYDHLDFPLALRGMRRVDKKAFAKAHRPTVLGLGGAVALFALIPIVGAFFQTTAVTGAVLLHRDLTS